MKTGQMSGFSAAKGRKPAQIGPQNASMQVESRFAQLLAGLRWGTLCASKRVATALGGSGQSRGGNGESWGDDGEPSTKYNDEGNQNEGPLRWVAAAPREGRVWVSLLRKQFA